MALFLYGLSVVSVGVGGFYHGLISGKNKRWGYCVANIAGGPITSLSSAYIIMRLRPQYWQLGGLAGPAILLSHSPVHLPLAYSLGFAYGSALPAAGYTLKYGLNRLDD